MHVPETFADWYSLAENIFSYGDNLISPVYKNANTDTLAKLKKFTEASASCSFEAIKDIRRQENEKREKAKVENENKKRLYNQKNEARLATKKEIKELEKEIDHLEYQKNNCLGELEKLKASKITELLNIKAVNHYETKVEVLTEEIENKTYQKNEKLEKLTNEIDKDIIDYLQKNKNKHILYNEIKREIAGFIDPENPKPAHIHSQFFLDTIERLKNKGLIKTEANTISLLND